MKKFFITYGDEKFLKARDKIVSQAYETHQFDYVIAYGRENLSEELLKSEIISIPKGGGLWSWKPDIIWQTMKRAQDGDIIVYCDSGCTIQPCKEWEWYWRKLDLYELVSQLNYNRTDKWTRKEILDFFSSNGKWWHLCYQNLATIVTLKVSDTTKSIIAEWRDIMLNHSDLAMDVDSECLNKQHKSFIVNRHDQAIYSALIYKYINKSSALPKIYITWERIEDLHPFRKQAMRATRLRKGEDENGKSRIKKMCKKIVKEYILYPFVFSAKQKYFLWRNKHI